MLGLTCLNSAAVGHLQAPHLHVCYSRQGFPAGRPAQQWLSTCAGSCTRLLPRNTGSSQGVSQLWGLCCCPWGGGGGVQEQQQGRAG